MGYVRPARVLTRSKEGLGSTRPWWRRPDTWVGYLFVTPQTLGFLALAAIPVIGVFWLSFQHWDLLRGDITYVGSENYARLFSDPALPSVLTNSVVFTGLYVPLNVGLGLLLALSANRAIKSVGVLRVFYFSPVLVSLAAWTVVFRYILQDRGLLNEVFRGFSLDPPNWLRESGWALIAVVGVQAIKTCGLAMVIFLAGLQSVPDSLLEAARVDGASEWKVIRSVTIPLITPHIFFLSVVSVIWSFRSFALIDLMTGGGPGLATTVMSYYIYDQGFQRFDMGYAAALAVLLFLVVLLITAVQFVIRRRWVYLDDTA